MTRRSILIGAVAMAPARLKTRDSSQMMVEICDALDEVVRTCLRGAPFESLSIVLRYVASVTPPVEIGRVNRHGEIEVGIEIPVGDIKMLDRDALKQVLRRYVHHSLTELCARFELDCAMLADYDTSADGSS